MLLLWWTMAGWSGSGHARCAGHWWSQEISDHSATVQRPSSFSCSRKPTRIANLRPADVGISLLVTLHQPAVCWDCFLSISFFCNFMTSRYCGCAYYTLYRSLRDSSSQKMERKRSYKITESIETSSRSMWLGGCCHICKVQNWPYTRLQVLTLWLIRHHSLLLYSELITRIIILAT